MKHKFAYMLSLSIAIFGGGTTDLLAAGYGGEDTNAKKAMGPKKAAMMKKMMALKAALPVPPPSFAKLVYAFPEKGQGVAGVRAFHFEAKGLIQGTKGISAATAVTTIPNRFFGAAGQPPTLRVVPQKAEADVVLPYFNFSVGHDLAVVGSLPLIKKKIIFETYAGGAGSTLLGTTTAKTEGLGDAKLGVLYRAKATSMHNVVLGAVLSLPTGSITEKVDQLTPANTIVNVRGPYGIQLGSGTYDAILSAAYWGKSGPWGWGAQYATTLPLEGTNSEGWRYGNKHEAISWLSRVLVPRVVGSIALRADTQEKIHGIDPAIFGPGLGANPDNYGGERVELGFGLTWTPIPTDNVGIEISKPIYADRNGVQLEKDLGIAVHWRHGFF